VKELKGRLIISLAASISLVAHVAANALRAAAIYAATKKDQGRARY
jgi:hypothetical protein